MSEHTYKRGMTIVVGHITSSYGTGSGFSTVHLATVTSISRDGSEVRAYRNGGSDQVMKVYPQNHDLYGPVLGVSSEAADAFTYRHTFTDWNEREISYRATVTVFGADGIEGVREAARWLRDAAQRWADTGEVPSGHNPEHPEAVHLSHLVAT